MGHKSYWESIRRRQLALASGGEPVVETKVVAKQVDPQTELEDVVDPSLEVAKAAIEESTLEVKAEDNEVTSGSQRTAVRRGRQQNN